MAVPIGNPDATARMTAPCVIDDGNATVILFTTPVAARVIWNRADCNGSEAVVVDIENVAAGAGAASATAGTIAATAPATTMPAPL